jgi:peptide/nickel transport system permease protein
MARSTTTSRCATSSWRAVTYSAPAPTYVEVAEARGERRLYIMYRDLLPTVMPPFLVDAGVRIPASIILIAGLSFLGLGIQPPASDWGLTIAEDRAGLTLQPWSVLGP